MRAMIANHKQKKFSERRKHSIYAYFYFKGIEGATHFFFFFKTGCVMHWYPLKINWGIEQELKGLCETYLDL